jgi:AraC-like DNA-binding protein
LATSSFQSQSKAVAGAARLLELIGDTIGLLEIDEFRHDLLDALRRAVPADWASLNDVGADPSTIAVIVDPPMSVEQHETFARYAHQNPLVEHISRRHDGRAVRFSDVITTKALHTREIYKQFYGPAGVEHQIAFTLPHARDRILGVALSRTAENGDFTDAERDLVEHARPFLIQAYRNAICYSELLDADTSLGTAPRIPAREQLAALGLSKRQAEVLQLVAVGVAEPDIATRLQISQRTVQKHLERCYRQLNVNNRSHAGAIAWSTTAQIAGRVALAPVDIRAVRSSTSRALLLQAALDEIEGSLSDSDLSPARVAERLGISSRYLHRLFADHGPSFGRWLLTRRLQRCHDDLTDSIREHWTISQIALQHGFGDPAYMTRAFKVRYGVTPRQLRHPSS